MTFVHLLTCRWGMLWKHPMLSVSLAQDAVKVMAKSIVRNRHAITKLFGLKSHLQAVSLRVQVCHSLCSTIVWSALLSNRFNNCFKCRKCIWNMNWYWTWPWIIKMPAACVLFVEPNIVFFTDLEINTSYGWLDERGYQGISQTSLPVKTRLVRQLVHCVVAAWSCWSKASWGQISSYSLVILVQAMGAMNKRMNIPAMTKIMREFEMQNEKMEMTSEMMEDAIDDAFEVEIIQQMVDCLVLFCTFVLHWAHKADWRQLFSASSFKGQEYLPMYYELNTLWTSLCIGWGWGRWDRWPCESSPRWDWCQCNRRGKSSIDP